MNIMLKSMLVAATAVGTTLAFALPQGGSSCDCDASVGPLQMSPFAGNGPAACYPLNITIDIYIEVLEDGICANSPSCPPSRPCTIAYDLKITGSAPCRIGVSLDGRLLGAGWLGSSGAFLLCVDDEPGCGESSTLQAVYGLYATPLFTIPHTCENCP